MTSRFNERAEQERRRWMRENAHLYVRPDAERFVRHDAHRFLSPSAEGSRHPDAKLFNPFFRYRASGAGQSQDQTSRFSRPASGVSRASGGKSAAARDGRPAAHTILTLNSDLAALRGQLASIRREIVARRVEGLPPLRESDARWQGFLRDYLRFQALFLKAGFDPDQPRVPAGNPDGGQWTSGGAGAGAGSGDSGASGAVLSASESGGPGDSGPDPPKVPKERPESARVRNRVIKEAAKWLVKVGARQLTGPVGTALNIAEGVSWLYEAYPYVRAYTDAPKTLQELQDSVRAPRSGYDVHHLVEQTAAEQDGYPRSLIDARENLVRIPTLKHWEITGWYMTGNKDYGGLSPRAYLRGKSWEERRRVGIDALIDHRVLKP